MRDITCQMSKCLSVDQTVFLQQLIKPLACSKANKWIGLFAGWFLGWFRLASAGLLWEENTVGWLVWTGWNQQANRLQVPSFMAAQCPPTEVVASDQMPRPPCHRSVGIGCWAARPRLLICKVHITDHTNTVRAHLVSTGWSPETGPAKNDAYFIQPSITRNRSSKKRA